MSSFRPRVTLCLMSLMLFFMNGFGAGTARAQASAGDDQNRLIVEMIEALRASGTPIIYSSDLLDASMAVRQELTASDPLARLTEALAQHNLTLQTGPQNTWLVVSMSTAPPLQGNNDPALEAFRPRPPLETMIVSASQYAFSRSASPSQHQVDRGQLDNAPTLGDDALRTTHGLPGLTSSGLSARVNVRGGETNEALLYIDGVRLYNPYHLKDFQSLFGSISPRVVDSIDIRTGGFAAEFGDRMSAVIEMHSITPAVRRHHEIEVSTLTTSVLSSGRFHDERGTWLTSLRRGNLDLLVDAVRSDVGQPQYTDFFNKLTLALSDNVDLTTGLLLLNDKITLTDSTSSRATADDDDTYLWLRFDHNPAGRFGASYLLARTRLVGKRQGTLNEPNVVTGTLAGARRFETTSLKADWRYELTNRQQLKWGAVLESADADYEFMLARDLPHPIATAGLAQPAETTDVALALNDRRHGLYVSYRVQPIDRLTADFGLRRDAQSQLDESQTSPRVAVMLDVGPRATLRASWGRFFQAQGVNELQVADGLTRLHTAQEAEHAVLSLEYFLGDRLSIRVEAYRKEFEKLRPRFENLFSRVSLLPELLPDRVMIAPRSGEASGVELSLGAELEDWQWWINLTRASVKDDLGNGLARRSWEEPWSAKGGAIWTGSRWTAALAFTLHSGWPVTSLSLTNSELRTGPFNDTTQAKFRSIDVRASREVRVKHGSIEVFMEVNNLLGFNNPCCFDYTLGIDANSEPETLIIDKRDWLPAIPSFGFSWRF